MALSHGVTVRLGQRFFPTAERCTCMDVQGGSGLVAMARPWRLTRSRVIGRTFGSKKERFQKWAGDEP
jgi:hypothetical protein